ncbi:hypothetical protein QE152_g16946 [Popillia japonica]|uniref:Uncharacterized protein n=1 Tax=Popillia japonica TaxID=7064 RepID=A0AAW1L5G7_POPJA
MNRLLEDFTQFQLKRKIKMDTILVEVRYSNSSIMTNLVQGIHEILLTPIEIGHPTVFRLNEDTIIGGYEILLTPIEIGHPTVFRLNEDTIIGGCTAMNTAKIAINHRNFGDVILIFKNTNIRDAVLMDLLRIYGDHSSSNSGTSV